MGKFKKVMKKTGKVISAPVRKPYKHFKKKHQDHKAKKEIEKEKENYEDILADLVRNGSVSVDDLLDPEGSFKNPKDVVEEYRKLHPEDDEPEKETEEEKKEDSKVVFMTDKFVFDENGNPIQMDSSEQAAKAEQVDINEIFDKIISNDTMKELVPDIKKDDLRFENGMILLNVKRDDNVETYRLDVKDQKIYVQAPMDMPYITSPRDSRGAGIHYKFVSVPIDTDLGKEILTKSNYIVKMVSVDFLGDIILRQENSSI